MIVAAAIKISGVVCSLPRPARHHDILRGLLVGFRRTDRGYREETQGFITGDGIFLNRKQAYLHVQDCKQGTPRRDSILFINPQAYNGDELYSEDLW